MSMPAFHRDSNAPISPQEALASLQQSDGSWEGEVIWGPMSTAQMVIARAIVGRPGNDSWNAGIRRYFNATQNSDGGWGMDSVSASCLFMTALTYVAARLSGEPEDSRLATRARSWIHRHPQGLYALPSWGKLWLAFIRLYPYEGLNPLPPEFFLLPRWIPFNADRMYCHVRYMYLGLAYLYGQRFDAELGELGDSLRKELYPTALDRREAIRQRHTIAESDIYEAPPRAFRVFYTVLRSLEAVYHRNNAARRLRKRALEHCLDMIRREIASSHHWCLSTTYAVIYVLALYAHDPADPLTDSLLDAQEAWRQQDEQQGIGYAGARSSIWDTAFALRALVAHPDGMAMGVSSARDTIKRGYAYLVSQQHFQEPVQPNRDRQSTTGGWGFCDKRQGWPVSDCAAEAVSALLACHDIPGLIPEKMRIPGQRLVEAIHFMLSRQNADGGFGSYERKAVPNWLEHANLTELFGRCMTELSYVECTASCVEALAGIRRYLALELAVAHRLEKALAEGIAFLRKTQQKDGSYPGAWGINYVYATSFVLRGLSAAGLPSTDPTVRRALRWIRSKQRPDGGWGEHHAGCLLRIYVENETSLISSTSWALLGLTAFPAAGDESVSRGMAWLANHREKSGLWPRERVNGVFFESSMPEYTLYNSTFPTWAMAKLRTG